MEMAPWSFQLIRYNLFWPHSRERMTATESVMSDFLKKTAWMQTTGITEVMDVKFSLPDEGWPRCQTGKEQLQQMTSASVDRVQPRASTGHAGSPQRLFTHTSLLSLPLRPFGKRAKSPFIRICWFRQTAKPRWLWWTHCVGWNEFPCGQLPCCCLTETRGSQSC